MVACHTVERITRSLPPEPAMGREGSNTHLGSIAVCIVDTGVMALVQPLKATGREVRSPLLKTPPLFLPEIMGNCLYVYIEMGTLR